MRSFCCSGFPDYGDDEYGFTYSDDDDVGDEDVEIENMYYNSKGRICKPL